MKTAIANAAFIINLVGLIFSGWMNEIMPWFVAVFFALYFGIGAYTAGLFAFGARK